MRPSVRRTNPSPRCRRHDCGGTALAFPGGRDHPLSRPWRDSWHWSGSHPLAGSKPTREYVCALSNSRVRSSLTYRRCTECSTALVGEHISLTNQIRSILLERGYVVAQGHARLRLLGHGRLGTAGCPRSGAPAPRLARYRPRMCGGHISGGGPPAPGTAPAPRQVAR